MHKAEGSPIDTDLRSEITKKFGPIPEFTDKKHLHWISKPLTDGSFQLATRNPLYSDIDFIDYSLVDEDTRTVGRRQFFGPVENGVKSLDHAEIDFWYGPLQMQYHIPIDYHVKNGHLTEAHVTIGFQKEATDLNNRGVLLNTFATVYFNPYREIPTMNDIAVFMPASDATTYAQKRNRGLESKAVEEMRIDISQDESRKVSAWITVPYYTGSNIHCNQIRKLHIGSPCQIEAAKPMVYRLDTNSNGINLLKVNSNTKVSDVLSFPYPQNVDLDIVAALTKDKGKEWAKVLETLPVRYVSGVNGLEQSTQNRLETGSQSIL
ncbi:MAG: hypothetical protein Q7K55_04115 [Candidatus Levybacteria bacterium]|nr:hypothetical protein [Candidatus Levybacteria bacterium]